MFHCMIFFKFTMRRIFSITPSWTSFITLSYNINFSLRISLTRGTQMRRLVWLRSSLKRRLSLESLLGFRFTMLQFLHIGTDNSFWTFVPLNFLWYKNFRNIYITNKFKWDIKIPLGSNPWTTCPSINWHVSNSLATSFKCIRFLTLTSITEKGTCMNFHLCFCSKCYLSVFF